MDRSCARSAGAQAAAILIERPSRLRKVVGDARVWTFRGLRQLRRSDARQRPPYIGATRCNTEVRHEIFNFGHDCGHDCGHGCGHVSRRLGRCARADVGPAGLAPVDYAFIGQTHLGNHFQINSGKLGKSRAGSAAVRDYARLMDTSHVQVEHNLMALLHRMNVHPPPTSLLAGAYKSLIRMMARERGAAFDHDYVSSQLDYQNANDALYRWEIQNGSNAELKAFARETLPKIDDHMNRVKALAAASSPSQAGRSRSR